MFCDGPFASRQKLTFIPAVKIWPAFTNNEIAQSEVANGRTFVHYWMHNAFLTIVGEKISKSLGNAVYLSDIIKRTTSARAPLLLLAGALPHPNIFLVGCSRGSRWSA